MSIENNLIVFRVDASDQIGTGHVMRCLTLAKSLEARGATCHFICRKHLGHLCHLIEEHGFHCSELPQCNEVLSGSKIAHEAWLGCSPDRDAQETIQEISKLRAVPGWLIVDHYAISEAWEIALAKHVGSVLIIDDLADRPHRCRALLDQNCFPAGSQRYLGLVTDQCQMLVGPKFALLRPEFARCSSENVSESRLLIFLGGVDEPNWTEKIARLVRQRWPSLPITILVGAANKHVRELDRLQHELSIDLQMGVRDVAGLMRKHQIAISAAGFSSYELAASGVPSVLLARTPIQWAAASALEDLGVAIAVKAFEVLPLDSVIEKIESLMRDQQRRKTMSESGRRLFDCHGAERVSDYLLQTSCPGGNLLPHQGGDCSFRLTATHG